MSTTTSALGEGDDGRRRERLREMGVVGLVACVARAGGLLSAVDLARMTSTNPAASSGRFRSSLDSSSSPAPSIAFRSSRNSWNR